jgi:hypothetical protein
MNNTNNNKMNDLTKEKEKIDQMQILEENKENIEIKKEKIQISEIENQIIFEITYNKCMEILYDCDIEY